MLINPYSQHQQEARALLEYIAQNPSAEAQFSLYSDYNTSVANNNTVTFKQETLSEIESLKLQLETSSEDAVKDIESLIKQDEFTLKYIENNYWDISSEDISMYNQLQPYITFSSDSFCFIDSSYSQTTIDLWK